METTSDTLQRITTQYIDVEDRIRLAGEVADGATVVIWLTRRLLQRVLPALLQWLEQPGADMPRADILQGFAQQAARAELTPQAPVRLSAGSMSWFAISVDIAKSEQVVRLTFKSADGAHATLLLAAKPLRQWLCIVHEATLKAEWPADMWPDWVRDSAQPVRRQSALLH